MSPLNHVRYFREQNKKQRLFIISNMWSVTFKHGVRIEDILSRPENFRMEWISRLKLKLLLLLNPRLFLNAFDPRKKVKKLTNQRVTLRCT